MFRLNRLSARITTVVLSSWIAQAPVFAADEVCPADFNGDYQAGLSDFAAFEVCLGGPLACQHDLQCVESDLNHDGAVDLRDFAWLQVLFQSCDVCAPRWQAVGDLNRVPGVSGSLGDVRAAAVFDDGCGPALYVAGGFNVAGSVVAKGISRWDSAAWTPLATTGAYYLQGILALAVYDDGTGPALYAGGSFSNIHGVSANSIAKWDGATWSPLGSGIRLTSGNAGVVNALTVFDDGTGPALYAGGNFTTAGGVSADNIAKWDGKTWTPLGSGVTRVSNAAVLALIGFDEGTGPALYTGGRFTTAGGESANSVAKWDGQTWTPLGSGVSGTVVGNVNALIGFDDGSGPALYAGGTFTTAGDVSANRIARWDGANWTPLGSGFESAVGALVVFDDGGEPALYAGGYFTTTGGEGALRIARWDGTSWTPLGSGTSSSVRALAVFDDGGGEALFAGGDFDQAGNVYATGIAQWNGATWSSLGTGQTHPHVHALAVFDDGGGPALYWGGYSGLIGKWDGATLTSALWELNSAYAYVRALGVFDVGSGPALYAGGGFNSVDGVSALGIARWDGTSWTPLGSGMSGGSSPPYGVSALAVYDDGTGPALYAGGNFTTAGEVSANNIARWDGASWAPLGIGTSSTVLALAVFDDGSGPALYAGGAFIRAGGTVVNEVAKWDGTTWAPLGSGMTGDLSPVVDALLTFDDGGGAKLYAGGWFTKAGGVSAYHIAKWNGATWASAGGLGGYAVLALAEFDDGTGPALYAGDGPIGSNYVSKWNGATWTIVSAVDSSLYALAAYDDGSGRSLYAGGDFDVAGQGVVAPGIARWYGPPCPGP